MELQNNAYYLAAAMAKAKGCDCPKPDGCEKTGYQYMDIRVPVEIQPDASVGKIEVECCGEPTVCCKENPTGNACEITIVQSVCLKFPIQYHVTACVGQSEIDCAECCQ